MTFRYTFLTQNEEQILNSYGFFSNHLNQKISAKLFLENLESFRKDLVKQGINKNIINFLRFNSEPNARLSSVQNWRDYWEASGFKSGFDVLWHQNKELRLFCMPDVSISDAKKVIESYIEFIRELKLDFKIVYASFHDTTKDLVKKCTLPDGKLNSMKFHTLQSDESLRDPNRGGSQHGDVTLVNQLSNTKVWAWGGTQFDDGSCVIYVEGDRQKNLDFISNVAKHEAAHMFGLDPHCNETDVVGYHSGNCLTLKDCTSKTLCSKCKDGLIYFWKGIEQRTKRKYFKRRFWIF